jgi:hypothetical protein
MNNIQRRLFRAFAEAGGDLSEDDDVERFIRYIEGHLLRLPPKLREATELLWRSKGDVVYTALAAQVVQCTGTEINASSLRERAARGARILEDAVRRQAWRVPATQT